MATVSHFHYGSVIFIHDFRKNNFSEKFFRKNNFSEILFLAYFSEILFLETTHNAVLNKQQYKKQAQQAAFSSFENASLPLPAKKNESPLLASPENLLPLQPSACLEFHPSHSGWQALLGQQQDAGVHQPHYRSPHLLCACEP